jgi:hypothetical protein
MFLSYSSTKTKSQTQGAMRIMSAKKTADRAIKSPDPSDYQYSHKNLIMDRPKTYVRNGVVCVDV